MSGKYVIISNKNRDRNGTFAAAACATFEKLGVPYVLMYDCMNFPEDVTATVILGGDGTLIRVADALKDRRVPLLGINTGTVGFLSGAESADLSSAIEKLVKGDFRTENRMMLDVYVNGKYSSTVLNDAVITRSGYSRIINVIVRVNGVETFKSSGDGVIVSTPTGSTGYNLSAGGTICVPEASMILITPICPHSMSLRSIIASDRDEVEIELIDNRSEEGEVGVTADGSAFIGLSPGDKITLKKSDFTTILVRTDDRTFFETLNEKLL